MWVLKWRRNGQGEYPKVEQASGDDLKYNLGRDTPEQVIEAALIHHRKRLQDARESVAACERCVAQLERLQCRQRTKEAEWIHPELHGQ